MLSQRLTAQFKVVSINDEATLDIKDKLMALYVQTRDFSLIEKEIEQLTTKPTVFYCEPLKAEMEYMADSILTNGSGAAWSIFRNHIKGADNFTRADGEPILKFDEDGLVSSDCRDSIPRDVYQELAGVVVHKANESTRPFMMPDTWLRSRIRSQTLRVAIANEKNAKNPDTQ